MSSLTQDNPANHPQTLARELILAPAELTENAVESILSEMLGRGLDAADIYLQHSASESWTLEDGVVKHGGFGIQRGAGVRALTGEKTGFAYSDTIDPLTLRAASRTARQISGGASGSAFIAPLAHAFPKHCPTLNPLETMAADQKVAMLRRLDAAIRDIDTLITQVVLSLSASYKTVLIMSSDGVLAADARPMTQLRVSVIAERNGRREQGSSGVGGRDGYTQTLPFTTALEAGREAVRLALLNLDARDAPAGVMPVVLGPGWPGVLLHEAVGHGLEGDFNRKGSSVYANRIGEQVASPLCTVVDDGTIANRRGSLNIDDEGVPTQRNVLIEDGILRGYLQDKHNASLMGAKSTGNGRRESYAHTVMPRMTNTFMLPGKHSHEEIIRSLDKGIYAANFGGGSVDITSGQFVFSTTEAYMVEKGRITAPLRGATLIGNGPEIMNRVSMVGDNFELDRGVGVCGKDGQWVPVGVGQPSLKIDEVTVGGVSV